MALEWEQVMVHSTAPAALGQWWADDLGWVVVYSTADEFEIRPEPDRTPGLDFVPLDEAKSRVHLDFRPDDQNAEVTRLQGPWHRAQRLDQSPPAGEEVLGPPGRDQDRREPPRVPGGHRQHRQLHGAADLSETDRRLDRGEPQVALGDIPGHIGRPVGRVDREIRRSQLGDPFLEHRDPTGPPTRSAITVAGIVGTRSSCARIASSNASTADPAGFR